MNYQTTISGNLYTGPNPVNGTFESVGNTCADAYRFGFNAQEKDNEIYGLGNSYSAEFWQYDARLGRRWNLDKVVNPSQSPYIAFLNNPIYFVDKNGDIGEAYIKGDEVVVESHYYFYGTEISQTRANNIAGYIQDTWNNANGKVEIDGKTYNVRFVVTATALPMKEGESDYDYTYRVQQFQNVTDQGGNWVDNFVRIESRNNLDQSYNFPESSFMSYGNVGFWMSEQIDQTQQTESHEHGEGLGLSHPQLPIYNGQLRIMADRANLRGFAPGDRVATQADIDDLNLVNVLKDKKEGERVPIGMAKTYRAYFKDRHQMDSSTRRDIMND